LGIHAGDDLEIYHHDNQINIIKKCVGAAAGILSGIKTNTSVTDEGSLKGRFE